MPKPDTAQHVTDIVRTWRTRVDQMQGGNKLAASGFALPEGTPRHTMNDFVRHMDDTSRQIIAAFPDMTPTDWDAFLDLLPNVRKILGLHGEGGMFT